MLPSLQGDYGLLPESPTPYIATLEEIFELFVSRAPYSERRKELWDVVPAYVRSVRALFPTSRILMDGGFTTHKPWAAPEDIDVSVGVELAHYAAVPDWQRAEVFNSNSSGGEKIRTMGGRIDASRFQLGNPDREAFWHEQWSSVRGHDRQIIKGLRKGYVEVIL